MAGGVAERVAADILPVITESGCALWDVEYVREGQRTVLRVTIDRDDGVDSDLCESVTRAILPVVEPVEYDNLEVSSPGLERDIRTPTHYMWAVGKKVDAKFFTVFDGVKNMTGILNKYDTETASVVIDGKTVPLKMISKCNIHFDFED